MGQSLFLECRILGKTTQLIQVMERGRLERRRNYLKWRSAECKKHVICIWVQRDCIQWKRDGMSALNSDVICRDVRNKNINLEQDIGKDEENLARQDVRKNVVTEGEKIVTADDIITEGYEVERLACDDSNKLSKTKKKVLQEKMVRFYGETQ